MLRCRILGHRLRFRAQGATMLWSCERGCGEAGAKRYDSPADAQRYALAFDRDDTADLGRRAPLLGMFPLRIRRALSGRRER